MKNLSNQQRLMFAHMNENNGRFLFKGEAPCNPNEKSDYVSEYKGEITQEMRDFQNRLDMDVKGDAPTSVAIGPGDGLGKAYRNLLKKMDGNAKKFSWGADVEFRLDDPNQPCDTVKLANANTVEQGQNVWIDPETGNLVVSNGLPPADMEDDEYAGHDDDFGGVKPGDGERVDVGPNGGILLKEIHQKEADLIKVMTDKGQTENITTQMNNIAQVKGADRIKTIDTLINAYEGIVPGDGERVEVGENGGVVVEGLEAPSEVGNTEMEKQLVGLIQSSGLTQDLNVVMTNIGKETDVQKRHDLLQTYINGYQAKIVSQQEQVAGK